MAEAIHRNIQERIIGGAAVALLHGLLAYALMNGLAIGVSDKAANRLKLFHVRERPPEPERKPVPAARVRPARGAASARSLEANATPVMVPTPEIRLDLPSPIVTAPLPMPAMGEDRSTGASRVDGPGTGAGGEGAGIGSGDQGTGTGGGTPVRARRIGGAISGASDYPAAARRAGVEGSVAVQFTVEADGSVSGCRVEKSTASPELDATTCKLVERRFRYEPALDGSGRPVPERVRRIFDWLLPSGR